MPGCDLRRQDPRVLAEQRLPAHRQITVRDSGVRHRGPVGPKGAFGSTARLCHEAEANYVAAAVVRAVGRVCGWMELCSADSSTCHVLLRTCALKSHPRPQI